MLLCFIEFLNFVSCVTISGTGCTQQQLRVLAHPRCTHRLCDIGPAMEELRTQKLKSHFMRTQSSKFLLLKSGVGQYIAMHATLTPRDFSLANFYPSGPFTCIFFQNLSRVFPVLAVANTDSCVGPQNKIGHPAGCRFPC